jgi:hypothetical protein
MKEPKTDVRKTITYTNRESAIVMSFYPEKGFGYAQTESGEIIHFNMNASRVLIRGEYGPFFTHEKKNVFPVEGNIICFIRRNDPVEPGKYPSMFVWNFEESYNQCLSDWKEIGPDREALKKIDELVRKDSMQPSQNNRTQKQTRVTKNNASCRPKVRTNGQQRWNDEPRPDHDSRNGAINLATEFEIDEPSIYALARGAGGKNGNTRQHHQRARDKKV